MITSKSIFNSNIVFVFDEKNFSAPENNEFAALYGGERTMGSRFIDDPVIRAKVLTLPVMKMKIALERNRLRIDDESQEEPSKSNLVSEAVNIYQKLFPSQKLSGFGFNFDIYFRFNNVIPIHGMFGYFFGEKILKTADLRDFGVQFSLDRNKKNIIDTWFLKITAPLELAIHLNRHFNLRQLPEKEKLQVLFENCYNETDEMAQNLEVRK